MSRYILIERLAIGDGRKIWCVHKYDMWFRLFGPCERNFECSSFDSADSAKNTFLKRHAWKIDVPKTIETFDA